MTIRDMMNKQDIMEKYIQTMKTHITNLPSTITRPTPRGYDLTLFSIGQTIFPNLKHLGQCHVDEDKSNSSSPSPKEEHVTSVNAHFEHGFRTPVSHKNTHVRDETLGSIKPRIKEEETPPLESFPQPLTLGELKRILKTLRRIVSFPRMLVVTVGNLDHKIGTKVEIIDPDTNSFKNKPFPMYEKLGFIFGKDRATGKGAKAPADAVEDLDAEETNIVGLDNIDTSTSENQPLSARANSHQSHRKRNRATEYRHIFFHFERSW
ncbi:hypothetical protein F0562_029584 [Nyssa sinensis]|uniref:Uncharacterized protein n=1 Tax=Nyssa sinensis TaxID=561372 RepID=A0A5J5B4G3_9ASTE|nr:hypothetical protein F0562_029584 [Nyssa sinensis]